MRNPATRSAAMLMILLMVAAACSGASEDPATSESPTGRATAAPVETTTETSAAAPAAAEAVAEGACGFGAELEADENAVAQIPGDGRQDTISALQTPDHLTFPEPLVELDRILSGGPPPDGIPPIDSPVFQTASTVDWLQCNEPVLSLAVNGEARAYPVQIMTWHELVNDTFGEAPVTVSYCPLCNSSLAYKRDLGDRVITLGTSGRLYNSSMVMYDRETESLWTHFTGGAVVGELTGTQLELLPMQTMSWANFLAANPDALVLTRDTGHTRDYGRNPYSGYDDVRQDPFLFDGDADPRLPAKQRVVGIRSGDDSVAVNRDALAEAGVIATDVNGTAVTVWHLPGTSSALERDQIVDGRDVGAVGVFVPILDGQTLTFSRAGNGFIDAETASIWNIQGRAIGGPLDGQQLTAVEHLDTFWFALAAFSPDTRIVDQ